MKVYIDTNRTNVETNCNYNMQSSLTMLNSIFIFFCIPLKVTSNKDPVVWLKSQKDYF